MADFFIEIVFAPFFKVVSILTSIFVKLAIWIGEELAKVIKIIFRIKN